MHEFEIVVLGGGILPHLCNIVLCWSDKIYFILLTFFRQLENSIDHESSYYYHLTHCEKWCEKFPFSQLFGHILYRSANWTLWMAAQLFIFSRFLAKIHLHLLLHIISLDELNYFFMKSPVLSFSYFFFFVVFSFAHRITFRQKKKIIGFRSFFISILLATITLIMSFDYILEWFSCSHCNVFFSHIFLYL